LALWPLPQISGKGAREGNGKGKKMEGAREGKERDIKSTEKSKVRGNKCI